MPPLANAQHEAFAQAVVAGCSLTEAAKRCGHKVGAPNFGSRLIEQPHIAQRVIELQAAPQENSNDPANKISQAQPSQDVMVYVGKPWVVTELVSLHRFARKNKDISGSNTALRTLAQIGGLLEPRGGGAISQRDPATLALLGIKEIHGMLTGFMGKAPRAERAKLLAEAPELRELVGDVLDAPEPEAEAQQQEPAE